MALILTKQEIEELRDEHRLEDKARYADRIKAIVLLGNGWKAAMVAEALLLDEKTVGNYRRLYEEGGLDSLCSDEYVGSRGQLSEEQLDELEKALREKIHPTTSAVIALVQERFGINYTVSGMTNLLHRMNFSYKKPKVIPGKANAQAQREFLEQLDELKKAKKPEDPILFMDGVHPQHNSVPAYGWLPVGEETPLKTNTGRQRVNLNGALDLGAGTIHVTENERLNAVAIVAFFTMLEARYPNAENIYIILDNAGYYKGQSIQEYLKTSKIVLMYLPPYAPNLNLIERVWKFFKKKVLANRYYESFLEFRKACLQFFEKNQWDLHKGELASLLTENFQIVGA